MSGTTGGPFLISTLPPSSNQRWLARAIVITLLVGFSVTVAFHDVQLRRYDAFVPIANTIICLNDVITAALLLVQFAMTRSRSLLALAAGFLFTSLMMIPHALSFPGAFAPAGLLGAGLQTTAWLYMSQHMVFLLCAIAYTALRDAPNAAPTGRPTIDSIIAVVSAVIAGVALTTVLVRGNALPLPAVMADATHTTAAYRKFGAALLLMELIASSFVFRRRSTTMIDLWLKVAMCSWVFETLFQVIVTTRFSLVFYVSRSMGVVSSSFVLLAFLCESMLLHRRLLLTLAAREQEREGHRSAIEIVVGTLAHQLRQPLTSIMLNGEAGTRLVGESPQTMEVAEILDEIRTSAHHADDAINAIRAMFSASGGDRSAVDVNALVHEAVDLMRLELEMHHVTVEIVVAPELPRIRGHQGQLLEVLLNGLKNGLEATANVADRNAELRVTTSRLGAHGVVITIEDSGAGLNARALGRAFDPFYTTKSHGMGLGLSICESIVSAHGGTVSLESRSPCGAVLRIELPGLAATHTHGARSDDSTDGRHGVSALGFVETTGTGDHAATRTVP